MLHPALLKYQGRPSEAPGEFDGLRGADLIDDVVMVDQTSIGRTTRSNPASYVGAFDTIRELFAAEPAAQERSTPPGHVQFQLRYRALRQLRRQRVRARRDAVSLGCIPALS